MQKTAANLTWDDIVDAGASALVPYSVCWTALDEPSPERDAARQRIADAINARAMVVS